MATVTLKGAGEVFHVVLSGAVARHLSRPAVRARFLESVGAHIARSEVALISWALVPARGYLGLVGSPDAVRALIGAVSATGLQSPRRQPSGRARSVVAFTGDFDLVRGDGPAFVAEMIAFQHNAPVRAGLCDSAWGSDWTSHRAYIHLCPRPPYLSCTRGLELCGMADTVAGRRRFDEAVLLRGDRCSPARLAGDASRSVGANIGSPNVAPASPDAGFAAGATRSLRPRAARSPSAAAPTPGATPLSLATTAIVAAPAERRRPVETTAVGRPAAGLDSRTAIPVGRVVQFAAAALGTTAGRLRDARGSGLARLGQHASAWCWVRRLGGPPDAVAAALGVDVAAVTRGLTSLDKARHDVARRLGDWLADDLIRGTGPRPTVGVPRPTAGAAAPPIRASSADYTDVIATHPPTALSDMLTAH